MLPKYVKSLSHQKDISDKIILGMHVFYVMNGATTTPRNEFQYASRMNGQNIDTVTFRTYKRRLEKQIETFDGTIIFLEDKRFYGDTIRRIKQINPANRIIAKTDPIDIALCDTDYTTFAKFLEGHHITIIGGFYRGETTFCSRESAREYGCVGALSWELRTRNIAHQINTDLTFK